jgi:hypothetical protein
MSTKPGMLSTMSGRLSTYPVKRLSTTSGNKQKTVNRNQEKTGSGYEKVTWAEFSADVKICQLRPCYQLTKAEGLYIATEPSGSTLPSAKREIAAKFCL